MEEASEWEASALFSPSKARVQQAQAKDWAIVDAWLGKVYGTSKRLPSFERNEDTLRILLSLASFNDAADEQKALIERVEAATLEANAKRVARKDDSFRTCTENLDGRGKDLLQALSETSLLLGTSDPAKTASRLCELTTEHFEASQQLSSAQLQYQALEREQARLRDLISQMKGDAFKADPELPNQTAEWTRSNKQLRAKIAEYDERLSALRAETAPRLRVEDVSAVLNDLEAEQDRLHALQSELSAYKTIPSDTKVARLMLQRAKEELRARILERDALFENMAAH